MDPARHEPIELLCLRSDLTAVPSFEFALRERVSHLAGFRRACFGPVRSVERLKNPPSALVLVSEVTAGVRLSDLLAFAEKADVPLDIDAALCLLRQIVPAVAMLHEQAPDVAHGAIAPERIVVTPNARIVMVEHVLGAALSELQYTRERYWKELRVALPGTTGPVGFNHRSDITQIGAVALALIVGRPLADDELAARLGDVVASSWAISSRGGLEPLPAGLRAWLMRALQLDPRESFESATDAAEDLERVLGDSDYMAAPASLEAFLAHHRAETGTSAPEPAWSAERGADPGRQVESPAASRPIESVIPPAATRVKPSEVLRPTEVKPAAPAVSWTPPVLQASSAPPATPPAAQATTVPLGVNDSHPGPAYSKPEPQSASADKTPIYVPPSLESSPIYTPPSAEKTPIYTPPSLEKTPPYVPPSLDRTPSYASPSLEKSPTYVPPSAEKTPPAYVPSSADKTPSYVPPVAEKTPAYVPLSTEKTASYVPSSAEKTPTYVPPAADKAPSYGATNAERSQSYLSDYTSPASSKLFDQKSPDLKPFDHKPVESKTSDYKPGDLKPVDYKPLDYKPFDYKSADSKPVDHKAVDHKPLEPMPIDPRPAMHAATDQKPSAPRTVSAAPDFSAEMDEPLVVDDHRSASKKKWWPAAAAVAVLALAGVAVPSVRKLVSPAAPANEGTLNVTTNPPGARLFVDGVERGATPLTVPLKPGPHSLEVRGDGEPRLMPITITAGAQVSQYLDLPKAAAAVGQLLVRTEPAGARVTVDGTARGAAPVTVAALTPGEHSVVVESDLGTVKQTVVVEAGNTASLTVPLGGAEGAPVSGWLALNAPAELQIFENKRLIGTSQTDRVMVSAGRHELELVNETIGYRAIRTVQVIAGKVTSVKVEFPKGTIALNAIPWAEVWVDGEKIGETPIGNLQVTIGNHDIVFRNPDLGEQRHKATVTLTAPARLSVDLRKK